MEVFKLGAMSDFTVSGVQVSQVINISMKTSDFHSLFERDRALRLSRTKKPLAPTNAPPSSLESPLGDDTNSAADGATSGIPMGYTHTRGVRMHIKITNAEMPDNQLEPDEVCSSGDDVPAKRERLVDKNAGPVLALMSVPKKVL
jgi:hypothetical protein